jgi:hypothetical protein
MVEHDPPPSPDSARPPVIPLPVALYVSAMNSFLSSMTGDSSAADFRSVGRDSFQRKKTSQKQPSRVPQLAYAHTAMSSCVP